MKVLTIGLDKNALNLESQTAQRLFEYAGLTEKLDIIILGSGGPARHKNNLSIFPTSKNKIKSLFSAYGIGKHILGLSKGEYILSTQDPFFTALISLLLKRKFKIPLQIQVHIELFGPYFSKESWYNKFLVFIARRTLPRADCIRVVSDKIKEDLIRAGIPERKVIVLPVFTDVEKIIHSPIKTDLHQKYPQSKFLMLMASRLVKQKNMGLAILSMEEITSKHPEAGLVIVGSGPEEKKLKELARNNPNIVFEPWSDDLVSYYKTSDLFLLPSFYEGFVRTAIEAMSAGCLVLMSDVILSGKIFSPGNTCLSFSLDKKQEFIDQVMFAIENPDQMLDLKQRALDAVKSLPSKEEYLMAYLKSWQNCLS